MKRSQGIVFAISALFWMGAFAQSQDPSELEKPPEIPPATEAEDEAGQKMNRDGEPLPPKVQDEQLEPVVTIREEPDRVVEEYRRDGQVYMVKITPKGGLPYYYVDTDGDGRLELDEPSRAMNPVQPVFWKIKEWK
jgi:hypothetical protein